MGGDMAVDVLDQVQAPGQVVQGHDGAELGDDRLLGRGGEDSRGLSQRGDDVVGAAEILLPDDFGLTGDAAAFACVVVGLPADGLLDKACHAVGHTAKAEWPSRTARNSGFHPAQLSKKVRSYKLGFPRREAVAGSIYTAKG